jgi:hypothetical protein
MALLEDYEFVRRLERAGPTCRIEDPPLITSSREFAGRWRSCGAGHCSICSIGQVFHPDASRGSTITGPEHRSSNVDELPDVRIVLGTRECATCAGIRCPRQS